MMGKSIFHTNRPPKIQATDLVNDEMRGILIGWDFLRSLYGTITQKRDKLN